MIIKFKSLQLNNFMSFADTSIKLDNDGYTLVNGVNNNPSDLATSNGSGKSSIWEGITWCLTGETIRGSKNVCNIFTQGVTSVELNFSIDNIDYKVIRTKEPSNLKIFINGEDKSGKGIRDSEKLLRQYLPDLTAELLGSVIILGQGMPTKFTNNSPSGRKDILEKMSKSDFMIEDLKNRITTRKTTLSTLLRQYEDLKLKLETQKQYVENNLYTHIEKLKTLVWEEKDEVILQQSLDNLEQATNAEKDTSNKLIDIDDKIEHLNNDMNTLCLHHSEEIQQIDKDYAAKELYWKEQESIKLLNISSYKAQIKQLESITDICPTCGQKLPDVVKPDTSELHIQLTDEETNLLDIRQQCEQIRSEHLLKEQEVEKCFQNNKLKLSASISDIKAERFSIVESIKQYKNSIDELSTSVNRLQNKKNNLTQLAEEEQAAIDKLTSEMSCLKQSIIDNTLNLENSKSRLDVISKMETYIKRDFRGYLLTNVIDYINEKCQFYSSQVFNSNTLTFKLDGNNISISFDGKEYEDLSGGEKARVDIIIQLALRDMLCCFLNFSSNILVLDEIFDSLDYTGCEKITNLIFNNLPDINCIYIITHRHDLPINCDHILTVVKNEEGISEIK